MPAFSPEVTQALSEDLHDCLLDAGVTEAAAKFLVGKKILKLAAFADLADNKAGIVEVVGRPAGLDPGNMIECQPLKSAWRDAEAKTKASLEAHAKGEDVNKDVTLGSEQRERLDDQLKAHFKVMWPAAWLSTNGLLGKIKRFYDKRTDFVPRIETDVRNILESEPDKFFNVFLSKGGSLQAQATQGSSAIHGLWKMRERHFQLMLAYSHAAFPEFQNADLTGLMEYHQWAMSKAVEGPYDPSTVHALLKADFHMRTRWMLSWRAKEFTAFTDVVKHHRGHSAYLFNEVTRSIGDSRKHDLDRHKSRSRSRTRGDKGSHGQHRGAQGKNQGKGTSGSNASSSWPGLVRQTANGKKVCQFYNKFSGCKKGWRSCPDEHECDFPNCGKRHSRAEHHPTPQQS